MVAMEQANFFRGDIESFLSKFKDHEKQLQQKRRWLLGLSTSEEEHNQSKRPKFLDNNSLPESLLREDDIFYDNVKSWVEEGFGVRPETGHHVDLDDLQVLGESDIPRAISSCINHLTTKGLYLLAKTLTGGRTDFEKTRPKMRKVVRESLSAVFGIRNPNHHRDRHLLQLSRQITQLLNDSQNFRDNHVLFLTSRFATQRAAVKKVLAELGNFSQQTLVAMHKKLRGVQPSTPRLRPQKNGRTKDYLIGQVRKKSEEMLSELDKGGDLPEPLAKAMAIADLSLKLSPAFCNTSAMEFYKFSPEVKLLQGEITKAIWLINTRVGIAELKKVKNLLDQDAKVSNRSLRQAIRNMLTEYLFECCDMDTVPNSLLETFALINKKQSIPYKCDLKKKAIEDETECILNLSAHAKQVLLDLHPAGDFDMDFTDAYMEDLEESEDDDEHGYSKEECDIDDCDNISQNSSCHSVGSNQEVESSADSVPFDTNRVTTATTAEEDPCTPTTDRFNGGFVNGLESNIPVDVDTTNFSFGEPKDSKETDENKQITYKNRYLAIQEACDQTSIVAYNLIGRVMEELGHKEGLKLDKNCSLYLKRDSKNKEKETQEKERALPKESDGTIIVRVTKELISSFPKSGIKRLKKLMGPR